MPTEKPRVTITMTKEQLQAVEDYRFENKIKNQTQAIISLVRAGLAELEAQDGKTQKSPVLTDEAMKVAKDYQGLDRWGRQVVRSVIDDEQERMEDEERFLEDTEDEEEEKVINLFVDGPAAGPAAGVTGSGCEPYVLGPNDPKGAAYAVRVKGDSMEPHFPDGSIVFVNMDEMRDGDIGVFAVDGATVIKQWHQDRAGTTYLFSLNRARADADLVFTRGSGRSFVWQGRVITKRRYDVPELTLW